MAPLPSRGRVIGNTLGHEVSWVAGCIDGARTRVSSATVLAMVQGPGEACAGEVVAKGRERNEARDVAIYLAREHSGCRLSEIGSYSWRPQSVGGEPRAPTSHSLAAEEPATPGAAEGTRSPPRRQPIGRRANATIGEGSPHARCKMTPSPSPTAQISRRVMRFKPGLATHQHITIEQTVDLAPNWWDLRVGGHAE